jgi:hypothetical protein
VQKACRADILLAHGVSRGLRTNNQSAGGAGRYNERECFYLRNGNGCLCERLHQQFKPFLKVPSAEQEIL